jgi:hypothetical protein
MFFFLIKKAFFDMWDHLFRIIILNLGFILVIGAAILIPYLLLMIPSVPETVLFFISLVLSSALACVYTGAASGVVKDISDYGEPGFRDFYRYLTETYRPSLYFGILNAVILFLISLAFPFYMGMKSMVGPLAFAFLFWVSLIWIIAIQFFFPLQSRINTSFKKNIKKIFLVFFDNTFFSLGTFLGSLVILVASSFTAFMLPGIGTILLWVNVAFKLRVYKYDYLEANPSANRKKIPWDALLIDEKERVGKRTLRGMIFPWKE